MSTVCVSTCTSDKSPPLQKPCKEQYLFLLELFVCHIQSPRLAKLNQMFCVPTTVAFRFLDFKEDDNLQLSPVDPLFSPQSGIADDIEPFYSGRSVLFALDHDTVTNQNREFKIKMNVFKKMPLELRPDVFVGKGEINMSMHFEALRKEMIDSARYVSSILTTPSKTFEDDVALTFDGCITGLMNVSARISSFGQTIVTEFETPNIECNSVSSFLFKAQDDNCDANNLKYKCRVLDPSKCNLSSIFSEDSISNAKKGRNDCSICKPKMPCSPCSIAEGALLSKRKDRGCSKEQPQQHKSCISNGCKPIQTSRGPKEPCGKAVVLKVSGLLDVCDDPNNQACVTVAPESDAMNPNDAHQDPDHDVFILRIGKKGLVGANEKSDIQLEMRTPKGPERRPPVRLETREMQTEEDKVTKKGGKSKAAANGKAAAAAADANGKKQKKK